MTCPQAQLHNPTKVVGTLLRTAVVRGRAAVAQRQRSTKDNGQGPFEKVGPPLDRNMWSKVVMCEETGTFKSQV